LVGLKPAGKFVAFLPSFEAVLESMAIYKTNPKIDRKNCRMFDSGQWQCFHTVKSIKQMMEESDFKKHKTRKVLQSTTEEIRQIKRIYGVNVSKHPSYHHFLVAEK
jgi:hypothetical protein